MKRIFKNILPIVLLLITVQLFAQDEKSKEGKPVKERYENFKERNISKNYPASGNVLNIKNTFGDVIITTWDKNEIKVDIHIEASSTDKDVAEKIFNNIDVIDSSAGNQIRLRTIINKEKNNNEGSQNSSSTMHINYSIQMPSSNTLKIENSFGDIRLPDYNGTLSLISKFGSLVAGKIMHLEKIEVSFAKKVELKSVGNAEMSFSYSPVTIGSLSGSCKLKFSFCSYSKINLDNSLTGLTVNDSYSSVHLVPPANLAASYTIATSYGSFVDKTNVGIKRTDTPSKYGPDLSRKFEGKSGSGDIKIDVKSSFGKIMIGEGTEKDMKEKKTVRT